jgi:hypothetical protein
MATIFNIQDGYLEVNSKPGREYRNNVVLAGILFLILLVFNSGSVYAKSMTGLFALFCLFDVFFRRALTVIVGADMSTITVKTGGLLDSKINERIETFQVNEVSSIEIVHVPSRSIDSFTLRFRQKDKSKPILISKGLSFKDCQKYSSEIQKFVGTHIPIVAVG